MRDEAVLGLLGIDIGTPGVSAAAFRSVNAAVSFAEQRTGGWAASGHVKSSFQHGLRSFATRFRPATGENQEMREVLAQISKATNGATLLPLHAFQAIFHGQNGPADCPPGTAHIAERFFMKMSKDGRLHADLKEMLQACSTDARLRVSAENASSMATAFFSKAGKAGAQDLSFQEFASVLQEQPEVLRSLHIGGLYRATGRASGNEEVPAYLTFWEHQYDRALRFLGTEDPRFIAWMSFFVLCQAAGFLAVLVQYLLIDPGQPVYALAKGSAQSIQIVMAIFLFTVCRNLLTLLRDTPLHWLLPLDEHLKTHVWLGAHLLFWSVVHSAAHIVRNQITPVTRQGGMTVHSTPAEVYKQATPITGLLLAGVIIVGYLFAYLKKDKPEGRNRVTRALRSFHTFQISHAIMVIMWIVLLVLHPLPWTAVRSTVPRADTWLYLLPSLIIYGAEHLWRFSRGTSGLIKVTMLRLLPEDVVELRMEERPASWLHHQQAGQYAYVMVPEISCWDWHPFTISSAPSDHFVSFHIKVHGGWTKALHMLAVKSIAQQNAASDVEASQPTLPRHEVRRCMHPNIRVALDGPFGAPSQDQKLYDVVVLVGAGVAVTPFLSILRQLVREHENSRCRNCRTPNHRLSPLRHVYFHWTVRDQASPRYLEQVLETMVSGDYRDFISINIHLTSALQDNDLRACIARMGQQLLHAEDGHDAFANARLPLPLSFGRPSWTQVLSDVMPRHPGRKIGVFVCAPLKMANEINAACNALNSRNAAMDAETRFIFRREHF